MRRTRLILALPVLLLSACNHQLIEEQTLGKGEVVIGLTTEERVEIVDVKSGTEVLPEADDFWVEVFNAENVKFIMEKYADVKGKQISMNAGNFTLVAEHGNPLGTGFDKPYYKAEVPFEVKAQEQVSVNAVAKLANVKVAVNYGQQIKEDYSGFYTEVKNVDHNKTLTFVQDETRAGYIPDGDLMLTVYATVDGALKCFTPRDDNGDPILTKVNPNDYITFNVNTGINYGYLVFSIKIDNGTELIEKKFDVPADAVGSDLKPSIGLTAFDSKGEYYVTEGSDEEVDDLGFLYKTYAGLTECTLTIDCEYMKGVGIPSVIDMMTLDDATRTDLENKGFFFAEHAGVGVIDFAEIVPSISANAAYEGENTVLGTFTLKITDENGDTAVKTARIMLNDVTAEISVLDYNVWAKKIISPVVTLANAKDPSYAKVQLSMDGVQWNDLVESLSSNPFDMGTYADLIPGTTYHLRVVYRDDYVISDVFPITTEADAQIANASFEDWNTLYWEFNHNGSLAGQDSPMNYYKPWASGESDIWWDSNTTNSLRPSLTIGYTFFKTFPLVHYSTDAHTGSKAAQITVANVGNNNSVVQTNGTWYVGELFLGKGNDGSNGGWSKTTDGHSFASRPSSLTFWYEYAPYSSSDFFTVEVSVKAQDGTVLATASSNGTSASEWQSMTLPLNYTVTNKKAASVHVSFKASGSSSHDCDNGGHYLEIAGSKKEGDMYRIKLSATLRIDDVTLNY